MLIARVRAVSPGHDAAGVFPGVLRKGQGVFPGVLRKGQGVFPDVLDEGQGVLPEDKELVGLSEFAAELGVAATYLRRVIRQTNAEIAAQHTARAAQLPAALEASPLLRTPGRC